MSREWQFFIHGEDSDFMAFTLLDVVFAGHNERSLRKVRLARYFLHLVITQAPGI
jgi:hypothetical protein